MAKLIPLWYRELIKEFGKTFYWIGGLALIFPLLLHLVFDFDIKIWEDFDIAKHLTKDNDFVYFNDGVKNHSFQFPIYPFLLAVLFKVFGIKPALAVVLNVILIVVGITMLFSLCNQITKVKLNKRHGLVSYAILLFYLPFNQYAYFSVHPFALNFCLMMWMLHAGWRFVEQKQYWVVWSMALGMLLMQRSSLGVGLVFFLPLLFNGKLSFKTISLIVLFAMALPLSWMCRNYKVDGVFAMTSTSGKILWKGVIPSSDGSNYINDELNYYSFLTLDQKKLLKEQNVKGQNDLFHLWYQDLKATHEGLFLEKYLQKLRAFWLFRDNIGNEYTSWKVLIGWYQYVYLFILLTTLVAVFYRREFLPLVFIFIALSLFQSYFYVETRHRVILEPFFISTILFSWMTLKTKVFHFNRMR